MPEQAAQSQIRILPRACMCGHDHTTHRGERVTYCLDCQCDEEIPRCQNCGEESKWLGVRMRFDVCSHRCLQQLEYAETRLAS